VARGCRLERTKAAFARSLDRLGLEYLDLYLIHQPYGDYYGSWRAMEELHRQERVRAIGVSNFHPDRLVDLICNNEVVPAVNQIEAHVFYQRSTDQAVMRAHKVQVESWGPFAEGQRGFFSNPTLVEVAAAHRKSVAQVALRWLVQREVVAIPKSVRAFVLPASVIGNDRRPGDQEKRFRVAFGGQYADHADRRAE
jgi:2,5-diketo-D-gluconate reductase A